MRVLLAEAQPLIREGLKSVALGMARTIEFVEAADAATALDALRDPASFDAVLFDATFLTVDELAAIRADQPSLLLVALTASHDADASARLLGAGVNALVPRSTSIGTLGSALLVALAGDICIRANGVAHSGFGVAAKIVPGSRRGSGPLNLTPRQYDVLALVAQGRANKAIAAELGIGLRTVKGHVSVVLRALHADNRADAARVARRWLARAAAVPPARESGRT